MTGAILEIYDKPTGKTNAIAMQHDVDYKGLNKSWQPAKILSMSCELT